MKYAVALLFAVISTAAYSQTYMDKIASQSCECITRIQRGDDYEQYTREIGVCMILASEPYKKQLKKEHGISFDHIDRDAQRLGTLIGVKMATVCPESVLSLVEMADKSSAKVSKHCVGTLTKFENDMFVVLHVKDQDLKTNKFYWMTFVNSDVDLAEQYETMVGAPVRITYRTEKMYDPKIKDYRSFSILEKLEAAD